MTFCFVSLHKKKETIIIDATACPVSAAVGEIWPWHQFPHRDGAPSNKKREKGRRKSICMLHDMPEEQVDKPARPAIRRLLLFPFLNNLKFYVSETLRGRSHITQHFFSMIFTPFPPPPLVKVRNKTANPPSKITQYLWSPLPFLIFFSLEIWENYNRCCLCVFRVFKKKLLFQKTKKIYKNSFHMFFCLIAKRRQLSRHTVLK